MSPWAEVAVPIHVTLVVAVVLVVARLGHVVAGGLRQPAVIAEIAVGLLIVPATVLIAGRQAAQSLMPVDVVRGVRLVGHVGLVLFLVGVACHLRARVNPIGRRALVCTTAGALLVPLACGGVLAAWVLAYGGGELRGQKPAVALVLFIGVSLTVTAVPVLARILAQRGLLGSEVGMLAMSTAVAIDVIVWLLVALAVGLSARSSGGIPGLAALVLGSVLAVVIVGRLLHARVLGRASARFPRVTATMIAGSALLASSALQHLGLTEIFGALLVGFAIPGGTDGAPWQPSVRMIARLGRWLVPVFFVATGLTVFARGQIPWSWPLILLVGALAIAGKVGGSYLGARLGGEPPLRALQLGVLLNTRGLTELVVLQAGYNAGILTPTLFIVFIVVALITTVMTGPIYSLTEHKSARAHTATQPSTAGISTREEA